ncbi:MAG: glycosyltransferase family 4 protein [Phycisphaeraceae bacterium]|nr:glycosyltransferase family 4 protein [Phycisphaeraceae bacterium]MCW5767592.1 glycosyltransferase family 4 protein [Phycisphaeraceae bacterium]
MNRSISTNAEGLRPSLLPPEEADGPVRILFLSSQTLGFATHSRSFEVYAEANPSVDAVHVRLRPPAVIRSLGRQVPGAGRSGLDFHRYRYTRLWAREMRRWFRTRLPLNRFDLVHVMTQHQALALASIPYPTRPALVTQIDATTDQECREFGATRLWRRPVIASERRVFAASSLISCWSTWAADSVIEHYGVPAGRVMVSRPAPIIAPNSCRQPVSRGGMVRICFVGNAWERKGGDRLLRWHQARWKDRAELHMFGEVPDAPPNARNVIRYGPVPHAELMDLHLPQMDLLVIPTVQDTLLLAGIEAASRGVPVVTSRLAGVSETVQHGVTGLLCKPGDEREFADAVESLLSSPDRRAEMGRNAVEFVRTNWNADVWHPMYIDTLVEIAKRHRAMARPAASGRKPGSHLPAPASGR